MSTAARDPASATGYDVDALRRAEFPWVERAAGVYLNNASTGPLPRRTVQALHRFNERRAEPHLVTQEEQFGTLERGRALVARLIGAEPEEIALTVNTGTGINLAARALPLEPGDVVVASDREFPANVYPWMALAQARGVGFELVPCRDGLPDEDALIAALDRPRVRALAVSWVSFATGYKVDLARLGDACRARGAWLVVDAIQGLGAELLDVRRTPVDVLACGAQKWLLSPWGTGFTYVRRALVPQLVPPAVSWNAMRGTDDFGRLLDYDFTWRDDARRFEMVTLPYQDFAGMNASLELLHELGPAAVAAHVAALADRIVAWAAEQPAVRLVTPADRARRAGVVSLAVTDADAASARLTAAGVVHSLREQAIRLSPHAYNTVGEVDRALALIGG